MRVVPRVSVMHRRMLSVLVLVALADFLFVRQGITSVQFHDSGMTIPLFMLAIAIAVAGPEMAENRQKPTTGLLFGLGLLASLETANLLTFCIAAAGLVYLTLRINHKFTGEIFADIRKTCAFVTGLPIRLIVDSVRWSRLHNNARRKLVRRPRFTVWVMPAVLTARFLLLPSQANPIL